MSMTNATPRIVFGGINDKSRGTIARGPVTFAQHCPLLRLFCETGPTATTYVGTDGANFNALFGSETLNRRGKYFNMQSLLAEKMLGNANGFWVKRLTPADAGNPARIIVALEIVADEIPKVQTALSGFDYPDAVDNTGGNTLADEKIAGYRARVITIADNQSAVGTQRVMPGTLQAEVDGAQSTIYPLFELPTAYIGAAGNNLGLRMWAPDQSTNEVFDEETSEDFKTRMFRVQFMQKSAKFTTPAIIQTAKGEDYVDVCFTEGAYSESTNKEYYIGQVLTRAYADDGVASGLTALVSPFSQTYVYKENIATVQGMIFARELEVNPAIASYMTQASQVNFLSMVGIDGDAYQSVQLLGALNGGIVMTASTTIYAQGGSDGTMNLDVYEELVNRENLNFGALGDQYKNRAKYPFTHIYDTGLTLEGKYSAMAPLAVRPDLKSIFTTFVEKDGRAPTMSEELSRLQAIMTRLQAYPESTLYGTEVCRGEIIMQTGELMDGSYSKPVPQLLDYAIKWARFAGAGTGILRDGADIDQEPNNRVTEVKNLNFDFMDDRVANTAWTSGGTWSQTYDVRSNFYPCIRSVYRDDTSVLLSPITVNIACDIIRMITYVHAAFSGNSKLTKAQLIERSNKKIIDLTNDRYAGRVTIVPETYFTAEDDAAGFSWHCRVKLYANNPRTVMHFDLETWRSDALSTSTTA